MTGPDADRLRDLIHDSTLRALEVLIDAGLTDSVDVEMPECDKINDSQSSILTVGGVRVWSLTVYRLDAGKQLLVTSEWLVDDLKTLSPRHHDAT